MKKYIFLLCLIGVLDACKDNDDVIIPACGVLNPLQDLEWLKTEVDRRSQNPTEDMKYCFIVQGEFETETVFRYEDCNPLVNKFVGTLNCAGERIDSNENRISLGDLKNPKIIWKTNSFECQVLF